MASSTLPVNSADRLKVHLHGLAPRRVYLVSLRTLSSHTYFLLHLSSPHGGRALPATISCGVRTFLPLAAAIIPCPRYAHNTRDLSQIQQFLYCPSSISLRYRKAFITPGGTMKIVNLFVVILSLSMAVACGDKSKSKGNDNALGFYRKFSGEIT